MAKKEAVNETPESLFPTWHYDDIKRHVPDLSYNILGNGFIKAGAGTLLTGSTGMGKSVLAMQLALCVASGRDFLRKSPLIGLKCEVPRRVLYIQAENDLDTVQSVVLSIVQQLELDEGCVRRNFIVQHVYGVTDMDFGYYFRDAVDYFKPELVVVDPYQSYVDQDLNSSSTFRRWVAIPEAVMKDKAVAMLLVCHKGKPRDTESWDVRELVYQQMGSSVQANWARASMELSVVKSDLRRFCLTFSKNAVRTGMVNEDGTPVRRLFIEQSRLLDMPLWEVCDDQHGEFRINYTEEIRKFLAKNPGASRRKVAMFLGCSIGVVQKYWPKDLGEAPSPPDDREAQVGDVPPRQDEEESPPFIS
ncbi:MAG: AAA family ATPase [Candidatus Methanomethylicaceae archaeon]